MCVYVCVCLCGYTYIPNTGRWHWPKWSRRGCDNGTYDNGTSFPLMIRSRPKHIHTCVCVCVCARARARAELRESMFVYAYVFGCVYRHMCKYAHTHTHTHADVCMHTHARAHTRTNARTRTHTHTHTGQGGENSERGIWGPETRASGLLRHATAPTGSCSRGLASRREASSAHNQCC